jgi:hypothetical protein
MAKSLTEAAKAVLMKESAGIPEIQPNGAGDPFRGAKTSNPNMASLKPGSKSVEPTQTLGSATKLADPVIQPNGADGSNLGAAAAVKGKDNSAPTKGAKPAEPMKKKAEVMEEDVELEEDVDQIDEAGMIPSGKIAKAALAFKAGRKAKAAGERAWGKDTIGAGPNFRKDVKEVERMTNIEKRLRKEDVELEEENDMEVELSEELESFIDQCLEEGMDEDQIAEAIEENFEFVTEEVEEESVMENYEVDMSEHVDALLAGEELSEEFRAKATAIFEAAVKQKVAEEVAVLEEAFAATLEEEVGRIEEELSTNVDDYLNYVVEQWTAENEVAIEASLRSELTEEFISGLRNLFVEHYIDIPEEAVSVVEEMGNKVAELEEKLNEEIERSVALSKMLNESKSNEILLNACDGLTDTQAEKLKSLAEGIEYADTNEYAQKITILKENYFSSSVKSDKVLDAAESSTDGKGMISEELNGPMAAYVRSLGKTAPR